MCARVAGRALGETHELRLVSRFARAGAPSRRRTPRELLRPAHGQQCSGRCLKCASFSQTRTRALVVRVRQRARRRRAQTRCSSARTKNRGQTQRLRLAVCEPRPRRTEYGTPREVASPRGEGPSQKGSRARRGGKCGWAEAQLVHHGEDTRRIRGHTRSPPLGAPLGPLGGSHGGVPPPPRRPRTRRRGSAPDEARRRCCDAPVLPRRAPLRLARRTVPRARPCGLWGCTGSRARRVVRLKRIGPSAKSTWISSTGSPLVVVFSGLWRSGTATALYARDSAP